MSMELSEYHKEVARTFSDTEHHMKLSDEAFEVLCRHLRVVGLRSYDMEVAKKWAVYHDAAPLCDAHPLKANRMGVADNISNATEELATLCKPHPLGNDVSVARQTAHALAGLGGEFHEVLNAAVSGDRASLVKELGDSLFYVTAICNTHGITLAEVMQANVAKLRSRYPDGFSADKAVNRDVAAEAAAMEVANVAG